MVGSFVGQVGADVGDTLRTAQDPYGLRSVGGRGGRGVGALGNGASGTDSSGADGFGGVLNDALHRVDGPVKKRGASEDDTYTKVHGAAEELVSNALVRPVLAKMRETNQAAPPFAPGLWEKTFGPMLDGEISKKIVRSSNFPLVDSLTKQLMSKVHRTGASQEATNG